MDHFSALKLCVSDAPPQTKHWAADAGDQAFKSNAKHLREGAGSWLIGSKSAAKL
jgi:hypothetical protein